jgi:hypothetical protein
MTKALTMTKVIKRVAYKLNLPATLEVHSDLRVKGTNSGFISKLELICQTQKGCHQSPLISS